MLHTLEGTEEQRTAFPYICILNVVFPSQGVSTREGCFICARAHHTRSSLSARLQRLSRVFFLLNVRPGAKTCHCYRAPHSHSLECAFQKYVNVARCILHSQHVFENEENWQQRYKIACVCSRCETCPSYMNIRESACCRSSVIRRFRQMLVFRCVTAQQIGKNRVENQFR